MKRCFQGYLYLFIEDRGLKYFPWTFGFLEWRNVILKKFGNKCSNCDTLHPIISKWCMRYHQLFLIWPLHTFSSATFLEATLFSHTCMRLCVWARMHAQSCPTLCDPMDCSRPGSSVHGISQARILEWVTISFSRGSSWPRDWTHASCTGMSILYHWATWEAPGLFLTWVIIIVSELPVGSAATLSSQQSSLTQQLSEGFSV